MVLNEFNGKFKRKNFQYSKKVYYGNSKSVNLCATVIFKFLSNFIPNSKDYSNINKCYF